MILFFRVIIICSAVGLGCAIADATYAEMVRSVSFCGLGIVVGDLHARYSSW